MSQRIQGPLSLETAHFDVGRVVVDKVVKEWLPTEKQLRTALRRAESRTARWARTLILRELRIDTGIPIKKLKRRVLLYTKRKRNGGIRIFIGLNPMPVSTLNPKKAVGGIRLPGGRFFSGAFFIDMKRWKAVVRRVGADRYPVEYVRIRFYDEAVRIIRADVMPQLENKFTEVFERELKWATR